MIDHLSLNKNYRKQVSDCFNQKYLKHIGTEVYKKYPNRIKLLEYALHQIKSNDNKIIILFQNVIFISILIYILFNSYNIC